MLARKNNFQYPMGLETENKILDGCEEEKDLGGLYHFQVKF